MSADPLFPPNPPRRAHSSSSSPLLAGLVLVLLVAVLAVGAGLTFVWWRMPSSRERGVNPDAEPRAVTPRGKLAEIEETNVRIYEENRPSVVHITTLVQQAQFGRSYVPTGTGSGFVWD